MKKGMRRMSETEDEFIASARRAFKRVARKLRAENQLLGLPLVAGKNGRVLLVSLNGSKS